MKSLQNLLSTFLTSKEKNLQLDFFRDNGQVLLQLYKQYDVNGWDIDYTSSNINASVLELRFHKDKSNNEDNKQRFVSSSLLDRFDLVEKDTYFMRIRGDISEDELEKEILQIINKVYDYNDEFTFTLNAY